MASPECSTYDRMFMLFEARVTGNCCEKLTRKLLTPMLLFFNMYEQERSADIRQDLLQEALDGSQFQWFYWTADDHYTGVGEWREFTPLSVAQLNKAVREKKTSVRLTVAQRVYFIDLNEMTKRLLPDQQQQGFHPLHSSVPIYAKANLRGDFNMEKLVKLESELRKGTERHRLLVKGILKMIKSSSTQPLDNELAHNALTLLLRLISLDGMVQEFLNEDGVKALLEMKRNPISAQMVANGTTTPPTLNTLATLILRQCIDSDAALLQSAFEQMITATCNGQPISMQEITSRRHAMRTKRYQKDVKRVVRMLVPLAVRSPSLYMDAAKKCMVIKQNEILVKEQRGDVKGNGSAAAASDQFLQALLSQIVTDLAQFDTLADADKNTRLMQPPNLLKLIAEVLRSYPKVAVPIFVEQSLGDQSVLRWIIERFLLSAPVNDLSDTAHWAKAVASELVSNSSSQRITDHVVGNIKSLLVESGDLDSAMATSDENNSGAYAKFADKVTILAKLTTHLRECLQVNNQHNAKQGMFIVKSIHKKNLANVFVRSIWKIPLHEKPGIDTVNTLLKLLEGMMTKNGAEFGAMGARSYLMPSFSYDPRSFQYYDDDDLTLSRAAFEEMNRPPANIDPPVSSTPREDQSAHQDSHAAIPNESGDLGQMDESMGEPVHVREDILDNMLDTTQEENEEGGESEEESPHDSEEEDMDTGEELTQQRPAVHEGAMEDDHISEAADANEQVLQSHLVADDDFEEMDDDDDGEEDEEDETEVEGGGELADFDDTLLDYVTDFNALAQQMHDIRRRINLNIDTNALTIRPQQVFAHLAPNNVRGAVLRIRAGARNFLDIERLIAFNTGQVGVLQNGTALNQLFSSLAGYGPVAPRESSTEDRSLPCFVDRMAEWCRTVEGQTMFVMGAIVSAHLTAELSATPEETTATEAIENSEQGATADADQNAQQPQPNEAAVPEEADLTSREAADNAGQMSTAVSGTNAQQPNEAAVPEGVDPAFLAALPEDMRQEVIRDHLLQQQISQADNTTARVDADVPPVERIAAIMGMEIPEGMDPAFLAALPDDIFHEVVRDHQRQQEMARQRRAQIQAQQQEANHAMVRHPHIHHRHFAMPRFLSRSIRPHTHRELPSTSATAATSTAERTMPLLDKESISTLLVLFLLDQEKFDIVRLQKLLKLICTHPGTCDFTIWALLSMFDGLDKFKSLEASEAPADGGKFQFGWINELRLQSVLNRHERVLLVTSNSVFINNQIRTVAAQRVMDNLAHLARSFARNFMPTQIRAPTGKSDSPPATASLFWNTIRSINGRPIDDSRKEGAKMMQEMVADSIEKSPLAQLFSLLDSNLSKESRVISDRIVRIISSLSQAVPSDFHEKLSDESKLWLGTRLKNFTNALMSSCTGEALRDGRSMLAEMFRAIPTESLAILRAIYESVTNLGKQLNAQLASIRRVADNESGEGQQSLLHVLKEVSGRENVPGKLLKSLETFQYLCNQLKKVEEQRKKAQLTKKKNDTEKEGAEAQQQATTSKPQADTHAEEESDEATLVRNMVDELAPLWEELSNCLSLLEKAEDSQHAVLCLQNAAEAFFLSYSLVIPQTAQLAPSALPETAPTGASSPQLASSSAGGTSGGDELGRYQKEMFTFAEKHRSVLNQILRGNTQNLEGSAFAILTHFPKLLDFDVKTKYFHKELKKMDERSRYRHEDVAIRVRRSHLFGDSFRELYRLRPNDWKARLYIIFEGEEGQDAGGLLREWYSVITREIFNPNYALFITAPGDRVTYMINKTSYVNPEHLDYFRFVGRVIAKAIYDNKQLDCYFTRAFYKHILNKHVRYQDIESEDPDLFKSLEFLLNNAVEDLGAELTFTVEVEEFGVRSTRQLLENGNRTTVTDANKHEYVHLMCQMKMTGSIRQQWEPPGSPRPLRRGRFAAGFSPRSFFAAGFFAADFFAAANFLTLAAKRTFFYGRRTGRGEKVRGEKAGGEKTPRRKTRGEPAAAKWLRRTDPDPQQLNAFLDGFYEVIPKKLISIFNEQELELLVSGLPDIDIDDLCANTEYKTYTRTSPQIQWFWRALKAFDAEDKAKFLQFVTGTSKVPLQGFSHLEGMNGVQKFTIQKDTRSNSRLPSAHTCFNQLDLPEYPDYETLHKMLLLASRECSEGFAFA
ncbi:hypothetical protein niasHT_007841 [Heterodera trifolii]|uniref:HECT-type E3 ubiquitin transferase n=1 Tax=Heterodera trifolii TaxID=157864 RepID=A0ABD2M255_9BILA